MTKSLDRLVLLETFVRIAERGSISAAARDLGLSQPSASRQLSELEGRLGAQLIRRTTHNLALTPAGQDLLVEARQMLEGWDALVERHGRGPDDIKGRLKIVAPIALGQLHLTEIMLRFQIKYPDVSVVWEMEDRPIRFSEVGCDCWIKIGPVPDETLIVRPLATVERLVVGSKTLVKRTPVNSIEELEQAPLIALSPFEGGRLTLSRKKGKARTLEPEVRIATNNIFAVHQAALLGAGYAVLPLWFVSDDLKRGSLIDVLPEWRAPRLTVNVAYLPSRHQPLRLRAFLDHLFSEVVAISGLSTVD